MLLFEFLWLKYKRSTCRNILIRFGNLNSFQYQSWLCFCLNYRRKTFNNYFWVEDLRWVNTWYYTTIQCDGLYWPNDFVITGVQLLWNSLDLIQWIGNQTDMFSNLSSWTDITIPQLYFYKKDNMPWNYNGNKYWSKPSIKVSVPNNAPAGTYRWKITYTLYDRSFEF